MKIPVIIVDDEPIDRYIARRVMKEASVFENIMEIASGDQFLRLVDDPQNLDQACGTPPPPVLVLLDINMPRVSGFEVLEQLDARFKAGERPPEWFVVMMFTSSNNPQDKEQAFRFSFVKDYIVKPLDEGQIERIIAAYRDFSSIDAP